MGYKGRECVLQALCESSQIFDGNGRTTMMQELAKTVFSMPKSKVLSSEHPDHVTYDVAYRKGKQRAACRYKCGFSLIKLMLGKYAKTIEASFM
jgi:hypothetical protein